jgi:hypothetical protein
MILVFHRDPDLVVSTWKFHSGHDTIEGARAAKRVIEADNWQAKACVGEELDWDGLATVSSSAASVPSPQGAGDTLSSRAASSRRSSAKS